MKISANVAILLMCGFFVTVLTASFLSNLQFPVLVVGREDSAGTWLSGALLTFMASACLFISMGQRRHPWLLLSAFFMMLTLDEHFMFHEQIKEKIIFAFDHVSLSRVVYEIPVIAGACAGGFMAVLLWQHLPKQSRVLIPAVVVLGVTSVTIDVVGGGVFWEECFKLLAELIMACALLYKINEHP